MSDDTEKRDDEINPSITSTQVVKSSLNPETRENEGSSNKSNGKDDKK